jgi:hypothetical protein
MNYDTKKHKPMIITTDVKEQLDKIKKTLILESLNSDGNGRISYGDTIQYLINNQK